MNNRIETRPLLGNKEESGSDDTNEAKSEYVKRERIGKNTISVTVLKHNGECHSAHPSINESQPQPNEKEPLLKVTLLQVGKDRKVVTVNPNWTILHFKLTHFSTEIVTKKQNVRLIYQGELLENNRKLSEYRIKNEGFIHVAISDSHGAQSRGDWRSVIEALPNNCRADGFYSDEELARILQEREQQIAMDDENDVPLLPPIIHNPREDTQDFVCGIWVFLFIMCNRRYARSSRFRYGALLGAMINLIAEIFTSQSSTRDQLNN
ncbi:HLA-B associated transcript-3-like isoform 2 [Reticulomyxa filosa]|uniref:HLA-B associated transcript-3-like isoform 2 n=1 Tax=Reticulomyxa filosa TaxID=46433 RepID=X6N3A1_RETFI|nr:HLA-B associated transcript-3-like isoform 2 [Reticulomyxa filosa]|eukprot:ETO20541.1 HLA-B associated transcript-3-like isoform 2 [Reticulomyxa filosa]